MLARRPGLAGGELRRLWADLASKEGQVMLVLSRKLGEGLVIDGQVAVTLVRVSPTSVRIGIEAPDGVTIVRGELLTHKDASPELASDELTPA
jgi:carbon storage regulator